QVSSHRTCDKFRCQCRRDVEGCLPWSPVLSLRRGYEHPITCSISLHTLGKISAPLDLGALGVHPSGMLTAEIKSFALGGIVDRNAPALLLIPCQGVRIPSRDSRSRVEAL